MKTLLLGMALLLLGLVHQPAGATAIPVNSASCTGTCGNESPTINSNGTLLSDDNGSVTNYQYVTTANGATGAGEISADKGTDGSSESTANFTLTAGQSLSMYFDFASSDTGYNSLYYPDYAWAALMNTTGGLVGYLFTDRTYSGGIQTDNGVVSSSQIIGTLAGNVTPTITAPSWDALGSSANTCWAPTNPAGCGYSGWNSVSYTAATAGTYYIEYGVTNVSDTLYQSALAVANIVTSSSGVTSVPEPLSIALLCSGLLFMAMTRRRASRARL